LGRLEESKKELEKAAADYTRYIEQSGETNFWGCPYQSLGVLYTAMGETSKAHAYCIKSAEIQENKYYVQAGAAILAYREGDYQTANYFIDRALAQRDKIDYQYLKGFISLALRQYDDAALLFGKPEKPTGSPSLITIKDIMADNFPTSLAKVVGQGHLALVENDFDLAETLFQDFLNAFPVKIIKKIITSEAIQNKENPQFQGFVDECEDDNVIRFLYKMACLGMGWVHANKGQHEEAKVYFEKVLAFGHKDLLAMIGKANAYAGLQRFQEAEKEYEHILSIYPNNKHALAELGIVKFRLGHLEEAESKLKQALGVDGTNFTCPYEGLGMLYLTQGKTQDAKKNFKRAIEINPDIEFKKYNGLARIYIKEGKIEQAKSLLQKSIKNYPYDNEAKEMLKQLNENQLPQAK
jgi:tetratricopeptide (TPR) repeat protein